MPTSLLDDVGDDSLAHWVAKEFEMLSDYSMNPDPL